MKINDNTFKWAQEAYAKDIVHLMNDTDEQFSSAKELWEYYTNLLDVGNDLGLDFWKVAKKEFKTQSFKVKNFRQMLQLVTFNSGDE